MQMRHPSVPVTRTVRLGISHRRGLALLLGLLMVLATWAAVIPSAQAGGRVNPRAGDTLTISGYDFDTDAPADVVAGSTGNNLVLAYTAGADLRDGTLVLELPSPDWPTALFVGEKLSGRPSDDGAVVVRPVEPLFEPGPADCQVVFGPGTVTVVNSTTRRVVVIQHVDCAAGQHVSIRVFGIDAPAQVGRSVIRASASDATGAQRATLRLPIVPEPRTRLSLDAPAVVTAHEDTQLVVRALRPNGRLDVSYRGTVAIEDPSGPGCAPLAIVTFTAADHAVKLVTVDGIAAGSDHLTARDVGHQAQPTESNRYLEVVPDDYTPTTCSRAYH